MYIIYTAKLIILFSYICVFFHTTGQSITAVQNPICVGENFIVICTDDTSQPIPIILFSVNGTTMGPLFDRVIVDHMVTYIVLTFTNATIEDRGLVFECIFPFRDAHPVLNVTLLVNCELVVPFRKNISLHEHTKCMYVYI